MASSSDKREEQPPSLIVYFDGYCNLCNKWVDRILSKEKGATFYFAPLTGKHARERIPEDLYREGPDAIILQEGESFLSGARAALRIARSLKWPYRALSILRILPNSILESGYRWIAKNRYKWYGKRDECRIPSPEERSRFLD